MTGEFYAALGHRVKMARTDLDLRQKDLARRTGLERAHISRIERGKVSCTAKTLAKLSRALDVSMDHLAGG